MGPDQLQSGFEDFVYKPLDLSGENIRVIKILPGPPDSMIRCTIHQIRLASTHVCLSYVWGTREEFNYILVNSKRFRVRRNLWNFLDQARSNGIDSHLWIDAICINQDFVEERNHQVHQMWNRLLARTCAPGPRSRWGCRW